MIGPALALTLALQQDAPIVDVPVYRDAALGVALPRPFDDWVFSPATERGTTTVILHPRAGSLRDELWGALVVTPWDGELRIGEVADRRIRTTWRAALGSGFALLKRDSLTVAGFPAIHAVMSGSIARAVVEVEEFLIARGSELVVLQFRFPRGLPRDSIAAGYARTLAGLRLGGTADPSPAARASRGLPPSAWTVSLERGQVVFETPQQLRAVAPGWLTAELAANGRRVMRFSPAIGAADSTLYAVGPFRAEMRRVGRLTIRIWRNASADTAIARATDSLVSAAARAWARYWRAFGPVPTTELSLVETSWLQTRGGPAMLFLGADAAEIYVVPRELARTWWGGMVPAALAADSLVGMALPEWAAALAVGQAIGLAPSPVELARRAAGDARFREALRTFLAESRAGMPATAEFLRVLGDTAALPIQAVLRQR